MAGRKLLHERNLLQPRLRSDHLEGFLQDHHQALRLLVDLHQAGFNARNIQNVVNQSAEAVGLVLDDLIKLMRGFFVIGLTIDQHFHVGLDAGERRAELVADAGDEVVLQLGDFLFPRHVVEHRNHPGRGVGVIGDRGKRHLENLFFARAL